MKLRINDKELEINEPMSVLEAAKRHGIKIPHFCDHPRLEKFGGCRMCLVDVKGVPRLQTSCTLSVAEGMEVQTESPRVVSARKAILEFLLINHPLDCPTCDKAGECVLQDYTMVYGPASSRFGETKRKEPESAADPLIVRNMERCIMCTRCIRMCSGVQGASAIAAVGKGKNTFIEPVSGRKFDCEYCGGCITVCPVGALMSKLHRHNYRPWETDAERETVCAFCGVGCKVVLQMRGQHIQRAVPREGLGVSDGHLCARGFFGYEHMSSPRRLTTPLVRVEGRLSHTTMEAALGRVVEGFLALKKKYGPGSIAGIASARCTNEDNYMFQKLLRGAFGTNHIDSGARLGVAGVRGMVESLLGSGATASMIEGIHTSGAVLVLGGDPTTSAPVLGIRVRKARRKGAAVVVLGQAPGLAAHSSEYLTCHPDMEPSALEALLMEVLKLRMLSGENPSLEDRIKSANFITSEELEGGVDLAALKRAATLLAGSKRVSLVLGRGLWGQAHGARSVLAASALAYALDASVHLVSERPNENGVLDMGCVPDRLPGGAWVSDDRARARFEGFWGVGLPSEPGMSLMEIIEAAHRGEVKGLYIMGDNPAFNLPDAPFVREALTRLEFLVVHDLFITETTQMAHVVIPARAWSEKAGTYTNMERRIQVLREATQGRGTEDWRFLLEACRAAGIPSPRYTRAEEVFAEAALISELYAGLTYETLGAGTDLYPYMGRASKEDVAWCREEGLEQRPPLKPLGRGDLRLALHTPLFHSGTLSRNSDALKGIDPYPEMLMSPVTAGALGLTQGEAAMALTLQGGLTMNIYIDNSLPDGVVFIPNNFKGSGLFEVVGYKVEPCTRAPYPVAEEARVQKVGS